MTQPIHPRTPAAELKLIRRAIRRLLQHPDNHAALKALRDTFRLIERIKSS